MEFDRPFIATRTNFKQNMVASEAIEFLKVERVPSEYRVPHNLLISFFKFARFPEKVDKFQQLVNIICYGQGPAGKNKLVELKDVLKDFFSEPLTGFAVAKLVPLFDLLVFHLAITKKISLPPVPHFKGVSGGNIVLTPWFKKLPPEAQFWSVASDLRYLAKVSDSLDQDMVAIGLEWSKREARDLGYVARCMRHYFAYQAISTFNLKLIVETFNTFRALTFTVLSPIRAVRFYSQIRKENLEEPYQELLNNTVVKIGMIPRIYQPEILDYRREVGLSDPYDFSTPAKTIGVDHGMRKRKHFEEKRRSQRKLGTKVNTEYGVATLRPNIAPKPENHSVYELDAKKVIQFASYSLTSNQLAAYKPERLFSLYPDNLWLAHQKDYLGDGFEKGTKKDKSSALRILNAYLFSYLPWFKDNVDPDFQIPERLEEFDPNLFIRRTHSFLLRLNSNSVLPVTLPEFQEKCVDLGAPGGKANVNSAQNKQRNLSLFFDSYIGLESLDITNPMAIAPPIRGVSYAESQKKKVDYDYFWLLRQFFYAFAFCSLSVREDLMGQEINSDVWKKKFLEYAEDITLKLGTITLKFSEMDGLDRFDPETVHVFAVFFCFVSQTGMRFTNAFWLDARTFDCRVTGKETCDDLIEVWVNTDKSKLKPFQTHVSRSLLDLLQRLNELRSRLFSDEEVSYQNNEKSKWGKIVPLFRFSSGRHAESDEGYIHGVLTDFLYSFQSLLKPTGYGFQSYIYPKVHGLSQEDIEIHKATRTEAPIKTFVVEQGEINDIDDMLEALRPASLVRFRSSITIHGLRKTFDSLMSLFFSPDDISRIWTGQTPEMVGYYSSNTVSDYKMAHRVAESAGLPFVIRKDGKDPAKVINDLKEKGIPSESVLISSVNVEDFDLEDEYKRAPDIEISVNRTHICPYANVCPKKIRAILDNRKLCGICPAALSFPSDAPSIAATIRKLGDEVASLSELINCGELTEAERGDSQEKRMRLIAEFSAWMVRHDHLIRMTSGEILVGEDGVDHYQEKLTYKRPGNEWSEEKKNLWRIIETSDVKMLQSEELKRTSRRYARNIIAKINPQLVEKVETELEVDPVKTAALFIEKMTQLQGLSLDEVVRSIEDRTSQREDQSIWKLLGVSDGE